MMLEIKKTGKLLKLLSFVNSRIHYFSIFPKNQDIHISGSIVRHGTWEANLFTTIQRAFNFYPKSLLLNLGANIGYYSLLIAKLGHQVIAGEYYIVTKILMQVDQSKSMVDRHLQVSIYIDQS